MASSIGKQIKLIRYSKNLSQDRFGKRVGLSGKTISSYENGASTPPLYVLERISEVYEVTIFDIPPSQKKDIAKRIESISNEIYELKSILESGLSL